MCNNVCILCYYQKVGYGILKMWFLVYNMNADASESYNDVLHAIFGVFMHDYFQWNVFKILFVLSEIFIS